MGWGGRPYSDGGNVNLSNHQGNQHAGTSEKSHIELSDDPGISLLGIKESKLAYLIGILVCTEEPATRAKLWHSPRLPLIDNGQRFKV